MKLICCEKAIQLEWKEPLDSESTRVEGECSRCGKHYSIRIWDNEREEEVELL